MPILQRQSLNRIPQRHLFLFRLLFPPVPVIAGPAHSRRLTHLSNRQSAALHLHLLSYRFEDATSPSSFFCWRSSSTRRKALSKKRISICCRPTSRSSSAIRLCLTLITDRLGSSPRSPDLVQMLFALFDELAFSTSTVFHSLAPASRLPHPVVRRPILGCTAAILNSRVNRCGLISFFMNPFLDSRLFFHRLVSHFWGSLHCISNSKLEISEWTAQTPQAGESDLRFRVSNLRCRIRPISNFPSPCTNASG